MDSARPLFRLACLAVSICLTHGSTQAASVTMQALRVNGRYLVKADNTPLFWLGDTAWFLPKLTNTEIDQYLSDRAQKGFNAILIACKYHSDILFNGSGAFINNNTASPNESFWKHVDYVVDQAEKNGLYVAMTVMWAEDYQVLIGGDIQKAYNLGKWLGARYRSKNNIVFVVSGEYDDTPGWNAAIYNSVAQGMRSGDLGSHLITIHPSKSSSGDFQKSNWLSFNLLQSGHYSDNHAKGRLENYELVANDYNLSPIKPVMDGEPAYEDLPEGLFTGGDPNGPRIAADTVRRKAYWAVFAGACGHTYGNENVEMFYKPGDPDRGFAHRYWKDALSDPGARQMRFLKDLIEKYEARSPFNRIPDQSMVVSGIGTGIDHVQACRAKNGAYAFVYIPGGTTIRADLAATAGKVIDALWFNPRDGSYLPIGKFPSTGTQLFAPPGGAGKGNDWVLVLEGATFSEGVQ